MVKKYTKKDMTPILNQIRISRSQLYELLDSVRINAESLSDDDILNMTKDFIKIHKFQCI
ncbi:hypothetical protein LCGC14_0225030 [marine sediment metagenome]|uniref:Uncharacterized protein n=1 Tax=marine sediment metagenome TaxID=412755 RepID=A0A0F9UGY9_9ZZZZ